MIDVVFRCGYNYFSIPFLPSIMVSLLPAYVTAPFFLYCYLPFPVIWQYRLCMIAYKYLFTWDFLELCNATGQVNRHAGQCLHHTWSEQLHKNAEVHCLCHVWAEK